MAAAQHQQRIMHGLKVGRDFSEFLSDYNRAYKPGMSCADILHTHAAIIEDAVRRNQPLACIMQDLAKFYDTIQLDEVEIVLRMKGAPDWVISKIRSFYHQSTLGIVCQYGETEAIQRTIGIQQGSGLSCLLCLLAIEPYLRYLQAYQENAEHSEHNYMVHGITTALPRCFSDDNNDYSKSVQGLQARVSATAPALHVLGIGVDEKILVIAFNIDLSIPQNQTIAFHTYDRLTGGTKLLTARVSNGHSKDYRLLGAYFKGEHADISRADTVLRLAQANMSRLKGQRMSAAVTARILKQSIIPKIIGHSPLTSSLTASSLSKADTHIANLGRNCAHLPINAPRGFVFAATCDQGLGFASATAEFLGSTARELVITLNSNSYEGILSRGNYEMGIREAYHLRSPDAKPGFIHRAILLLASYGFYLHCSSEDHISRALMVARDEHTHVAAHRVHIIARAAENKTALEYNARFAANGTLALSLRLAEVAANPQAANHPLTPSAEVVALAEAKEIQLADTSMDLAGLLQSARDQAGEDWSSTCDCFGISSEARDAAGQDTRNPFDITAMDTRLNVLKGTSLRSNVGQLVDYDVSVAPPGHSKFLFTATDGSDRGAAMVVLSPTDPGTATFEGDHVGNQRNTLESLYNKECPNSTVYRTVCSVSTGVPSHIGSTKTTSYDTECCAAIMDLMVREEHALGPMFIDNQSVHQRLGEKVTPLSARDMHKQARSYLMNPIRYLKSKVKTHDQTAEDKQYWKMLGKLIARTWITDYETNKIKHSLVCQCDADASKHPVVKVKSHQDDKKRVPLPCTAAVYGNERADELAGTASANEFEHTLGIYTRPSLLQNSSKIPSSKIPPKFVRLNTPILLPPKSNTNPTNYSKTATIILLAACQR